MQYYAMFRPRNSFEFARKAVAAGIQGFEIIDYQSYLPGEEFSVYLDLIRRVKEELSVGLTVHAPFVDVHLGSLNRTMQAAAEEEIRASVDLALALAASVVVVHPSPSIFNMPGGEWSKQVFQPDRRQRERTAKQERDLVQSLRDLADYAPDLLFGLENLVFPHEMYRSPEEMKALLTKVDRPNVAFTLDAGHAVVCGHKPADYLHLLEDELVHVHLHDNHGTIDEHLPLGEGIIDYVGLIQTLQQIDYGGVVLLEFEVAEPGDFARYIR